VGGGEVVEEHHAGAHEVTAGLRAGAGRALARALVACVLVVHDVALAAEHLVGAGHRGGADDVVLAAVGVSATADVTVAGAAVVAHYNVPGGLALRSNTKRVLFFLSQICYPGKQIKS
jgi:hypothetical protein